MSEKKGITPTHYVLYILLLLIMFAGIGWIGYGTGYNNGVIECNDFIQEEYGIVADMDYGFNFSINAEEEWTTS